MLARKMLRDLKMHKTQFLSIFLMAFLGVFVFSGVGGESLGLEVNSNQFYEDTNLADGWIYSPLLNDLFLYEVYCLGATTEMERHVLVDSQAVLEKDPDVSLHFVENNTVSKFYLVEGEPLNINDSNGVWLDKNFANAKGLKIGDDITFRFGDYEITKKIRGLGFSPEYVYHGSTYSLLPDFNKIGFAYLSYKAYPSDNVPYNVLNVKFDGTPESYEGILSYHLGGYYITFLERSEHSSVSQFENQITLHKMMADVFPVVFILVSMLMLLTTMTRIINHQRTQIGILKSSGFKNRTIIWHYMSYGFLMVLSGSVLGLILGPLILPKFLYNVMGRMFTLPSWEPVSGINFVHVVVLMILMSLVVMLYSAKVISDENPAQSIRPKVPKVSQTGFVERFRFWQGFSFNTRWNYRDAKRNKFRALMTVIGVVGCTSLLVCAFGLYDTMNDLREWEYDVIRQYESELFIDNDASQSIIEEIERDVDGDEIMEGIIEIQSPSAKKTGMLLVLNGTDLISTTDEKWNEIEIGDDEVSISRKMAELLDVGVGDTVKWHTMDSRDWVEIKIDKIHVNPNSQGFIMSKGKLEDLGLNFTATSLVTDKHIDTNYSGIKSVITRDASIENWNGITEAAWLLIYALIIFSSLLAIIVLYNLGLLSFTEIEREIASLKVLGFKTKPLRRLLLTQNLWFTTIGFLLGLPIGYYILIIMWSSAGESFDVVPRVSITNVLLTALITFSLSIIVNLMFSRKIKKLDMVESLKRVD